MGGRPGDWVGAPEDRRTAFHGRRLWRGHPTFSKDGRRHRRRADLARVGAGCGAPAESSCGAESCGTHDGSTARVAPVGGAGGRVVGRAGASLARHDSSRALPIKWVGGRGLGGRAEGPEDGCSRPQASARPPGLAGWRLRLRRGRAQRGREQFGGAPRAEPICGAESCGSHDGSTARVAPVGGAGGRIGGPSRSYSGGARMLAGPPHQMGGGRGIGRARRRTGGRRSRP